MGLRSSKPGTSDNLDSTSSPPLPPSLNVVRIHAHNFKIVHFVRHAQGVHNEAAERDGVSAYLSEEWADAHLTELGLQQCRTLGERVLDKVNTSSLLVVSPMNRTIETAVWSFPSLVRKIPWIALDCIREQTGQHPCDRRSSRGVLAQDYPFVEFDEVATENDNLYNLYAGREPEADVERRGHEFIEWLLKRPEKEIIVVTHSAWLRIFLRKVLALNEDDDAAHFHNAEMRTFCVSFGSKAASVPVPAETLFSPPSRAEGGGDQRVKHSHPDLTMVDKDDKLTPSFFPTKYTPLKFLRRYSFTSITPHLALVSILIK
jgi:broad specificity phosphatase PhoE